MEGQSKKIINKNNNNQNACVCVCVCVCVNMMHKEGSRPTLTFQNYGIKNEIEITR